MEETIFYCSSTVASKKTPTVYSYSFPGLIPRPREVSINKTRLTGDHLAKSTSKFIIKLNLFDFSHDLLILFSLLPVSLFLCVPQQSSTKHPSTTILDLSSTISNFVCCSTLSFCFLRPLNQSTFLNLFIHSPPFPFLELIVIVFELCY